MFLTLYREICKQGYMLRKQKPYCELTVDRVIKVLELISKKTTEKKRDKPESGVFDCTSFYLFHPLLAPSKFSKWICNNYEDIFPTQQLFSMNPAVLRKILMSRNLKSRQERFY